MGDKAKFGLPAPEIIGAVEALRDANLLSELRLLHFHVGSQINDIAVVKDALQEASRLYVELHALGAPMGYLDVGGGLGIDYDGSRTATAASTNYSLQNYANDVVATVKEGANPTMFRYQRSLAKAVERLRAISQCWCSTFSVAAACNNRYRRLNRMNR